MNFSPEQSPSSEPQPAQEQELDELLGQCPPSKDLLELFLTTIHSHAKEHTQKEKEVVALIDQAIKLYESGQTFYGNEVCKDAAFALETSGKADVIGRRYRGVLGLIEEIYVKEKKDDH